MVKVIVGTNVSVHQVSPAVASGQLRLLGSILEAHQGVLDAIEAPGGGAWFSMTLPVDLPPSAGAAEVMESNP